MRYRGVDIDCELADEEFEYLKTINWLTALGHPLLERIGGYEALERRLNGAATIHSAQHGVIVQAGPHPVLGDVNRGERALAYRAVFRALEAAFAPEFTAFDLEQGDDEDMTEAWYRRFAEELSDED